MTLLAFPIEDVSILNAVLAARFTDGETALFGDVLKRTVHIEDFIPTAQIAAIRAKTSTYDIYAHLLEAIAALPDGGGTIEFGNGLYKINSTVHLKKAIRFQGAGGMGTHYPEGPKGTVLLFGTNVPGFIAHGGTTDSTGIVALSGDAGGTTWENLSIFGALDGATASTGTGIWMRTQCRIVHCNIERFGVGVHIYATAVGGDETNAGNANSWYMAHVNIGQCGSHSLHVDGPDANAGIAIGIIVNNGGGKGIFDSSFLGNAYFGCHVAVTASDSYCTDDGNARNVFVGCYSEASSTPPKCIYPTIWIGGLQGAGFHADHTALTLMDNTITPFDTVKSIGGRTVRMSTFGSTASFLEFNATSMDQIALARWHESSKTIQECAANNDSLVNRIICTALSTGETGGRSAALTKGSIEFPLGFWIGSGTGGRQVKNASAMPNSGEYARGDFVYNTLPAIDGNDMVVLGWSRLTTGSNHVSGTDWAICHVSHVTPAT
jgi:hypothetical protein